MKYSSRWIGLTLSLGFLVTDTNGFTVARKYSRMSAGTSNSGTATSTTLIQSSSTTPESDFFMDAAAKRSDQANSERTTTTINAKNDVKYEDGDFFTRLQADVLNKWNLLQRSLQAGYNFKQSMAIVIAGEYDEVAVRSKIESIVQSEPCVMFTWGPSPSCKQAIRAMDIAGAKYRVVRLDEPWSEGNPIRAEIGKMVGKSSVPMIFIGGKYVGGYDGGVSDEAPGIVDLAFRGELRTKLESVGALRD